MAATALCAFLASAGVALAGYQGGAYTGATEQLEDVSFRADEGKVRQLSTAVFAGCSDGTRLEITVERGRTAIDDDRFALELEGKQDLRVSVTGRLRAERANGRIEAIARPPGTVCKADVRWQAQLAKPRG